MVQHSRNKVMDATAAIQQFVKNGDCLAFGGFVTNRRAYALVHEIIRQNINGLYIEGGSSGGDIDMLIGAGCVKAILISYIANSGYTQVCRRFRAAVEQGTILFDDYSIDTQTIAYHAAALGLPYVPVKNTLGSDLSAKWGISREERAKHPKLTAEKFILAEDPFHPGQKLCLVPAPAIDTAILHVQKASPDGTCRIEGPEFQDIDIAMAAKHTIVSCEELVSNEEIRRLPEFNNITGLCIDAVVHMPYGAHPSQCFNYYDYDPAYYREYDEASRTQDGFDAFARKYVYALANHTEYLNTIGTGQLLRLHVQKGRGYVHGLKRK